MSKQITLVSLVSMLACVRGARPATIVTATDPKLLKTGNPFRDAIKISHVNVMINFNYANAVNAQRGREGAQKTFEPSPRQWGERVNGVPFVIHQAKGTVYLECKVQKSISHVYQNAAGDTLDTAAVEAFLPTKRSNAEHQGVEREVIVRDYAIQNIQSIAIDGETYTIDAASIEPGLAALARCLGVEEWDAASVAA